MNRQAQLSSLIAIFTLLAGANAQAVQIVGSSVDLLAQAEADGTVNVDRQQPLDLSVFDVAAFAETTAALVQSSSTASVQATFHPSQLSVDLASSASSYGDGFDVIGTGVSDASYQLHFRATRPTRLVFRASYDLTLGDASGSLHLRDASTEDNRYFLTLPLGAGSVSSVHVVPAGEYHLTYLLNSIVQKQIYTYKIYIIIYNYKN